MIYNLNNVKEMKVTEEFLTLHENIRNCQNTETILDCRSRKIVDRLLNECNCLPFSINQNKKVHDHPKDKQNFFLILGTLHNISATKMCSENKEREQK